MSAALQEIQAALAGAVERHGPAVVGIGRGWGVGSGVVIERDKVLTTAHNLRHDEITVGFINSHRAGGRLIATDDEVDLAVIEVETGDIAPLEWGEAGGEITTGAFVLALANPGGRGLHVTPGFVAGTAAAFRGARGRRLAGAIEHTAPLPRGSSGGPLIGADGRLLGLNAVRIDHGLILAVPANSSTRARVEALGRGERREPTRLGVAVAPPRVARRLRRAVGLPERDGVLIRAVQDGSPAERAGLERGDLLVSADGGSLDRLDALYEALDRARGAGKLELGIVRGTEERQVEVVF